MALVTKYYDGLSAMGRELNQLRHKWPSKCLLMPLGRYSSWGRQWRINGNGTNSETMIGWGMHKGTRRQKSSLPRCCCLKFAPNDACTTPSCQICSTKQMQCHHWWICMRSSEMSQNTTGRKKRRVGLRRTLIRSLVFYCSLWDQNPYEWAILEVIDHICLIL